MYFTLNFCFSTVIKIVTVFPLFCFGVLHLPGPFCPLYTATELKTNADNFCGQATFVLM